MIEVVKGAEYIHVKTGRHYKVLNIAKHTETGEYMVAYQSLYDEKIWVRPLEMFADGRFERVIK